MGKLAVVLTAIAALATFVTPTFAQTNTSVDVAVERAVFLASLIAPTNEESLVTVGEVELIEHEG